MTKGQQTVSEFTEFHARIVAGPTFGLTPGGRPCAHVAVILHDGAVAMVRSSNPHGLEALERAAIGNRICGNGRHDTERAAIDARWITEDDGWDPA
jgi:hypothetical protein